MRFGKRAVMQGRGAVIQRIVVAIAAGLSRSPENGTPAATRSSASFICPASVASSSAAPPSPA
jgi:hypothetical protein